MDPSVAAPMVQTLDKMRAGHIFYQGSLTFFPEWEYFVPEPSMLAQETWTGPYAGLLDGYK
jgi:acid phosphatase